MAHALAAGTLMVTGFGRTDPSLPYENTEIALTFVAGPDQLTSELLETKVEASSHIHSADPVEIAAPASAPDWDPTEVSPIFALEPASLLDSSPLVRPQNPDPEQPASWLQSGSTTNKPGLNSANTGQPPIQSSASVGLVPPAYRKNPKLLYPSAARRLGQEGLVRIAASVTLEGRASRVVVKQSSGFVLLDEAAVKAVRSWQFTPARANSNDVECDIEVPVRFHLAE